jgi:copper chaperone
MTTRTFTVQGMTCAHCQAAVTKALKGVPGVTSAEVDLQRKQAKVGYDADRVNADALAKAVKDAGYTLASA